MDRKDTTRYLSTRNVASEPVRAVDACNAYFALILSSCLLFLSTSNHSSLFVTYLLAS